MGKRVALVVFALKEFGPCRVIQTTLVRCSNGRAAGSLLCPPRRLESQIQSGGPQPCLPCLRFKYCSTLPERVLLKRTERVCSLLRIGEQGSLRRVSCFHFNIGTNDWIPALPDVAKTYSVFGSCKVRVSAEEEEVVYGSQLQVDN